MASRAGTGIEMNMDKIPLREEGMTPYEIMLSESQERMLAVVEKGREEEVLSVLRKWDLDAEVVGVVTNDGVMRVRKAGKVVVELPIAPLVHAAPVYERPAKRPAWQDQVQALDFAYPGDSRPCWNDILKKLVSSPNLCSKKWVYTQYDHMVGTDTVVLPGSDAAVLRIKGTKKGVALSVDCNARWCYLDPYWGAAHAIAECARNIAASGGRALAVTDCLNFGNPERPEIMWQFEQACLGMSLACKTLGTPIVSGNVSFYNETGKDAIYPTPAIAMIGVVEDIERHATQFFKDEGDIVILLGENTDELGGSEYLKQIHGKVKGAPPTLNFDREINLQKTVLSAIGRGVVKSAHDISTGGIAVAVAECCMKDGGDCIGATIKLEDRIRGDAMLFGEAAGRIVVTCDPKNAELLLTIAKSFSCPAGVIGKVGGKMLLINDLICVSIDELYKLWSGGLNKLCAE
jgi:phosphoribosylformylglycinamidine synthase